MPYTVTWIDHEVSRAAMGEEEFRRITSAFAAVVREAARGPHTG